jgi:hypothetical protein
LEKIWRADRDKGTAIKISSKGGGVLCDLLEGQERDPRK